MAEIRATVERNDADIGGAASALAKIAAEETLQTLRDEIDSVKITDLIVSLYLNENVKVFTNKSRYLLVYNNLYTFNAYIYIVGLETEGRFLNSVF